MDGKIVDMQKKVEVTSSIANESLFFVSLSRPLSSSYLVVLPPEWISEQAVLPLQLKSTRIHEQHSRQVGVISTTFFPLLMI